MNLEGLKFIIERQRVLCFFSYKDIKSFKRLEVVENWGQ